MSVYGVMIVVESVLLVFIYEKYQICLHLPLFSEVLKSDVNRFLNLPIQGRKIILKLILERDCVDPLFNLTAF